MAVSNPTDTDAFVHMHDACALLADEVTRLLDRLTPYACPHSPLELAALREAWSHLGAARGALRQLVPR